MTTGQTTDTQTAPAGRVVFVGGGPGDPDLLTLAAVAALQDSDTVICDSPEHLDLLRHPAVALDPHATVVTMAELAGSADPSPDLRAALAVEACAGGRRVVRLVSGDPFLDGDAALEAAAIVRCGADFDVVPGVSALTAVPEFAGVPLSVARAVMFIPSPAALDARAAGWGEAGTLVVAARGRDLPELATILQSAGRDATEQALATIAGGSTRQHSVLTTVAGLATAASAQDADATVHLVVGQAVAGHTGELDWYESRALFGWRILIPRTKDMIASMVLRLRGYGAQSEEVATISVEQPRNPHQLDKAIRGLVEGRYQWVAFTSHNAVRAVREKLDEYGLDARAFSGLKVAAASEGTAESLKAWGIEADLVPVGNQTTAGLADAFPSFDGAQDPINRVFLPRADIATESLAKTLTDLGWEVEDVTAYRTVRAAPPPAEVREAIKSGQFDAVVFSSSSTVRNLVGIAGKPHASTIVAAIGPATARTCEEHGLRVDVVADYPSGVMLADALATFAARRRDSLLAAGEAVTRPSQRRTHRRRA